MSNKRLEELTKVLLDPKAKSELLAAASSHPSYIGKKPLGLDVVVTMGGLVGAAWEFGFKAVHDFFDGVIAVKGDRSIVDAMRDYQDFVMPEERKK